MTHTFFDLHLKSYTNQRPTRLQRADVFQSLCFQSCPTQSTPTPSMPALSPSYQLQHHAMPARTQTELPTCACIGPEEALAAETSAGAAAPQDASGAEEALADGASAFGLSTTTTAFGVSTTAFGFSTTWFCILSRTVIKNGGKSVILKPLSKSLSRIIAA
jgi:hypothetical protein